MRRAPSATMMSAGCAFTFFIFPFLVFTFTFTFLQDYVLAALSATMPSARRVFSFSLFWFHIHFPFSRFSFFNFVWIKMMCILNFTFLVFTFTFLPSSKLCFSCLECYYAVCSLCIHFFHFSFHIHFYFSRI